MLWHLSAKGENMFRLLLGVVGMVGVLIAVPLLFVGGGLFIVDTALTDSDGFFFRVNDKDCARKFLHITYAAKVVI